MDLSESDEFMRIVESKLGDYCAYDMVELLGDNALKSSGTVVEGNARVMHRLIRVVSSSKTLATETFYPVRFYHGYALPLL